MTSLHIEKQEKFRNFVFALSASMELVRPVNSQTMWISITFDLNIYLKTESINTEGGFGRFPGNHIPRITLLVNVNSSILLHTERPPERKVKNWELLQKLPYKQLSRSDQADLVCISCKLHSYQHRMTSLMAWHLSIEAEDLDAQPSHH